MAGLGQTTAALRRRQQLAAVAASTGPAAGGRLQDTAFAPNPGNLRMLSYAPAGTHRPALVVVLHGCSQTAEAFQEGAGWGDLAERHGFALLCPEQSTGNNPGRCFNWFEPAHTGRGRGETASIRQKIERAVELYDVDVTRIFITGLSAGGAMAGAMLAVYPEVFAGGAIIAGLPYGAAANVQEAFGAMMQPTARSEAELGRLVRQAAGVDGPWPAVSVWHGEADSTVHAANAEEIVKQWRHVHGLSADAAEASDLGAHRQRVWRDADGRAAVTSYTIAGMAHGAPVSSTGADRCGAPGPFLLEAGISSSWEMAMVWGLIGEGSARARPGHAAAKPATGTKPANASFDLEDGALAAARLVR
jgi:poly(hydroxyalkanoate) depolymerase family esterase